MDIPRQSIDNTRVDSTTQTNVSQVHQQPEPPVIGQSPRRVPPNVLAKMRYLEKPKSSSKGWRILKNIGFALAGAGLAFALASNPVGWGVAATIGVSAAMMAIGGLAAAGGTYKTIKADIYRADVKAYAASLDGPGPIKEE